MNKRLNISSKASIKAFIFVCFVGTIYLLAQVLSYFNSGADPKNILNLSKEVYAVHTPAVDWHEEDQIVGLELDKYEKRKIEEQYLLAWHMMNLGLKLNNLSQLTDFFSDSLLVKIENHLNPSPNYTYEQLDLEHNIHPKFLAIDKQLLVIEDKCVKLKKRMYGENVNEPLYEKIEYFDYKVALSLDDGRWRINHMERIESVNCSETNTSEAIPRYTVDNKQFFIDNLPIKVKGINYYPAKYPWSLFWKNFDVQNFNEDIVLMKGLNFNAVRIFIPFEEFGGAYPKIEYLNKLNALLDALKENNMMALITLFDFPPGFEWDYYTRTDRHLEKILLSCDDHPAILAYDLKNEPDLDIELYGSVVEEWLEFIIERTRKYAPENLITIGWSSPSAASILADKLDFVSFHYYGKSKEFLSILKNVSFENKDRLVVVSEFGYASYEPDFLPISKTPIEQQQYTAELMQTIDDQDLPYFFWTLHDFSNVPSGTFSILPWRTNQQKHFGIIDTMGKEKPVASVFKKNDFNLVADKNPIPKYVKNWFKFIMLVLFVIGILKLLKSKFRIS